MTYEDLAAAWRGRLTDYRKEERSAMRRRARLVGNPKQRREADKATRTARGMIVALARVLADVESARVKTKTTGGLPTNDGGSQ